MKKRNEFLERLLLLDTSKMTKDETKELTALIKQFNSILNDFIKKEEI